MDQAPLSMEFFKARILEWVACPFSSGIFPNPGTEPGFPALQGVSLTTELPGKALLTAAVMYLLERSGRGLLTLLNEDLAHLSLHWAPLFTLASIPSFLD